MALMLKGGGGVGGQNESMAEMKNLKNFIISFREFQPLTWQRLNYVFKKFIITLLMTVYGVEVFNG
jgi:NADPH-dependent 7-cyano-7-deazaguanine reductase QueF